MRQKYETTADDVKLTVLLSRAEQLKNSFKVGDFIRINTSGFWNSDAKTLEFTTRTIDLGYFFREKEERQALFDIKSKQYEIPILFEVIDMHGDFPIVAEVSFDQYEGDEYPDDLLLMFENFINDVVSEMEYECTIDDPRTIETMLINACDAFCKLDDDYSDSMLLETEFVPYEREVVKLKEVREEIDKFIKRKKSIIAKKAAETRAENKRKKAEYEDKIIEFEFKQYLEQLEIEELFEQIVEY